MGEILSILGFSDEEVKQISDILGIEANTTPTTPTPTPTPTPTTTTTTKTTTTTPAVNVNLLNSMAIQSSQIAINLTKSKENHNIIASSIINASKAAYTIKASADLFSSIQYLEPNQIFASTEAYASNQIYTSVAPFASAQAFGSSEFDLTQFINLISAQVPVGIYLIENYTSFGPVNYIPNLIESNNLGPAICKGTTLSSLPGNGTMSTLPQLNGTTTSTILWPKKSIPDKFTICSITRYSNPTTNQKRILQAQNINWIHGHWFNSSTNTSHKGVSLYNNWITNSSSNLITPKTDWLIMCGSNNDSTQDGNHILADGVPVGIEEPNITKIGDRLSINSKQQEASDFGLSQIIIWDRQLSNEELVIVNKGLRYYLNYPSLFINTLNQSISSNNRSQQAIIPSNINYPVISVRIEATANSILCFSKIGFRTSKFGIAPSNKWIVTATPDTNPAIALFNEDDSLGVNEGYISNTNVSPFYQVSFYTPILVNKIYIFNANSDMARLANFKLKVNFADNTSTELQLRGDMIIQTFGFTATKALTLLTPVPPPLESQPASV
jgi:hypothetical protein